MFTLALLALAVLAIALTRLDRLRDLADRIGGRVKYAARVTADNAGASLTLAFAGDGVTASTTSRTLSGVVVRYGVHGHTSKGKLKVAPGALRFPDDVGRVKLTREHERENTRGHMTGVQDNGQEIRASLRVSDGPEGDAALREAQDRTRDGLSFDIVDATIVGDTITAGYVVAIGQVGIPAYEDGRIDTIAAAATTITEGTPMTDEQRQRFAELLAMNTRSPEEETEFAELAAAASAALAAPDAAANAAAATAEAAGAGGESVAASMPAIPSGVPRPGAQTQPRPGQAFATFVSSFTDALRTRAASGDTTAITAALSDITHSAHTDNIEPPAWSGELWSGLQYESEWSDLFNTGDLTNWNGVGWRFTSKMEIQDYAGDKAAIPSDTVTTESSAYEAARMAVGVDVDRKFYDFPNEGFVESLWQQVRESWAIKLDAKVRAYVLANDVAALDPDGVTPVGAQPSLLKAAAVAVRALKRLRVGKASWVYVNDDDLFTLLDIAEKDVPVFLDLYGIDPRMFRSSQDVPEGTVLAGVKPAATVRTLPGSPIRVDAQNIANGGIDNGFFGYWAIEEHHTKGIASATFTPPA